MDEALSRMFEDLKAFTYFEPNIAKFKLVGANRGHFVITDPNMAGMAELGGLSIDVIFYSRSAERQLLAVTTGRHPLVGVRMWRAEKAGFMADRTSVIKVITEAYDQANGWLNDWGRYHMGRGQQRTMWTTYLSNIEAGWYKRYRATRSGKNKNILLTDQKLPNPFRPLLPPELQKSEYKYYDYVVP
jgi:hypothetical protein